MVTPVKYTGNVKPFFELAITGSQQSWYPGQVRDRSDADAALLVGSGNFAVASTSASDNNADQIDGNSGVGAALPAPPTNVLALAANGGATVQWTANKPLPSLWRVTAVPGGASVTVALNSIRGSATFSQGTLTNGTAYAFIVSAVNGDAAAGRASALSNSVTPTALPSSILPVTRKLEFWWSARQTVSPPSNGSALASMVDLSGNGYNFAGNGGGGTWVSSWSSAKPAVALNGSSQYYDALATGYWSGLRGPNCTIFALHDVTAQPAGIGYVISAIRPDAQASALARSFGLGVKLGAASTSNEIVLDLSSDYYGNGSAVATGPNVAWGTPIRASVTMPGGLRAQGAAVTGVVSPRIFAGAGAQPWTIGCMYGGGFNYYLQGRIAEIIVYADTLTASEVSSVEAYLATGA